MRNYTIIPKDIIGYKSNSKLSDIFIFVCIKSPMNYRSGIAKINQETLFEKYNTPIRTLRDAIQRLEKQHLLNIERKVYKNRDKETTPIRKNQYHFNLNPENYFFVYNDFLKLNLQKEVKGFLLLLRAVCFNNTNAYTSKKEIKGSINKSELSKLINIDVKTIDKYLNMAKELNEVAIIDNTIIVKNNCFPVKIKDNNSLDKRRTEIVNTIQEICNKYNAVMPIVNDKYIDKILIHYPLLEEDIQEVNSNDFEKYNSLRYVLNDRIKSLPTRFNIEYILEVLNIAKPDKNDKPNYEFIL